MATTGTSPADLASADIGIYDGDYGGYYADPADYSGYYQGTCSAYYYDVNGNAYCADSGVTFNAVGW